MRDPSIGVALVLATLFSSSKRRPPPPINPVVAERNAHNAQVEARKAAKRARKAAR